MVYYRILRKVRWNYDEETISGLLYIISSLYSIGNSDGDVYECEDICNITEEEFNEKKRQILANI